MGGHADFSHKVKTVVGHGNAASYLSLSLYPDHFQRLYFKILLFLFTVYELKETRFSEKYFSHVDSSTPAHKQVASQQ